MKFGNILKGLLLLFAALGQGVCVNEQDNSKFFIESSQSVNSIESNELADSDRTICTINSNRDLSWYKEKQGNVFTFSFTHQNSHLALWIRSSLFLKQFEFWVSDSTDPDSRYQLVIRGSPIITEWTKLSWDLPVNLEGKILSFEVINVWPIHPSTDFAFTHPFSTNGNTNSRFWFEPIKALFQTSLLFVLMVFPGLVITLFLVKDGSSHSLVPIPIILISLASISYLIFWIFYLSSALGILFVFSFYCALILFVFRIRRNQFTHLFENLDFKIPMLLWCLAIGVSLSSGFLFDGWEDPILTARGRYLDSILPHDNFLPYLLSLRVFDGLPLHPFFPEWQASDRPPLQASIVLFLRLFDVTGTASSYQFICVILHCSVIPIVYVFVRVINHSRQVAILASLTTVFTASFIVNSFYVWPKLLPVSFMLMNVAVLFFPDKVFKSKRIDINQSTSLGLVTTLALLTHGGSIIGIVPMYFAAFVLRKLPALRFWPLIILPFLVLQGPWSFYQKVIDPPGDKLLKWHLAGFYEESEEEFSTIIKQQYQSLDFDTWISNKEANIKRALQFDGISFMLLFPYQFCSHFPFLRNGMFSTLSMSLLFQIPFLLVIPGLLLRKSNAFSYFPIIAMLATCLGTFVFWVLLIFTPGTTTLHQGTYFLPILLGVIMVVCASKAQQHLTSFLSVCGICLFSIVWVLPGNNFLEGENWIINQADSNLVCLLVYLFLTVVAVKWIIASSKFDD